MKNLYNLLIVVLALFFFQNVNAQSVFINEIHYDNSSTDVGEAIEIAGPAGTDVTNWSIVLYNGSNGSVYNTATLNGTLPDLGNGFGVVVQNYPSNGIQNGSPDGIALVDNLGNTVQFLSYEGSFTAVGGPADGITSEDILVAEIGAPIGNSLQLTGEGTDYTSFTWAPDTTNTFGSVNISQSLGAPQANLVINEIDADNPSTDAAEFIELYDGGVGNTPLDGFVVVLYNGSNNLTYNAIDLDGQTTNSAGYFVIGSSNVANVDLIAFTTNGLQNGADAVALYNGDDISFPTGTAVTLDSLVDAIVYDTNDSDDAELLALLNAGEPQLNEDENGDKDNQSLQRIPNGDGGLRNTSSYAAALPTPGAENTTAVAPAVSILINEIDADNPGTDDREFIELYDGGVGNSPLDGWVVVLYNGSNNSSYNAIDLDGFATNADGYFVIGSDSVANVDLSTFSTNGLQNGADAVALYKADASDFPSGSPVSLDSLIDAVVYDTNDSDDAELLVLLNGGEAQLNEDENGDKDNQSLQRIPNGEGGLRNTSSYAATTPTPGAANRLDVPVADFVVINEIDADQASTDAAEFVELFDGGAGNTALDGLVLVLFNGNGDASYNAIDLNGQTTDADGYFVIGSASVPNVDLAAFTTNGLQNGADAVALYQGEAASFPNGTAATATDLIDAVVYGTSDSDDAELLAILTPGQAQVDENGNGAGASESMQRIPNGSGGQLNTTAFSTDVPTPGASNGGITPPPTGDVISIAEARASALGTSVTVQGVVTASDQFGGPAYIQDTTAGIPIFDATVHGDGNFNIGDVITVSAQVSEFRGQIQLGSVSTVELVSTDSIVTPTPITLAELAAFEGQLVSIANVSFPTPNDLIFGNSNITVSDASGSGIIRVDGDVSELVGKVQPVSCDVVGVIGSFEGTPQLLPRFGTDLPCAGTFVPPSGTTSSDSTLDVVTWNIEWFGNLSNGPSPESTQKEEAQAVIDSLDADLYAFQEISDAALLQQIADDLPEYELVVNFANVSNPPDEPGVSQKLAFLYRTSVITPLETKGLLASIHPSYNGGDASALVGFPDPNPSRFYASGRLPFLMVADVNLNGVTERVNFINLHARANSSNDALGRYNMRRYDVTVLKDTLDAFYADQNVVLLGDYNDDVDETVADVDTTLTSYDAYVNDPDNYAIKTIALSNAGFRSFAFRENMIDHIGITNELFDNYIDGSEIVHYEFFDSDYAETTSDHFPVSASFNFEQEITFNDFTAVEVVSFNQGRKRNGRPVHRFRSNPNKALGRPLENYYFNFVSLGFGGDIVLKLDNFMYDLPGDEFKVFESTFGRWNIPCHWYPEKAEVFVSEDGVDFTSLGIACQDGKFDLAGSGVDKALFIKIKDVSDPRLFRGFADGYDLDGIYNLIQEPQANGRRATLEDHDNFVQNEVGEFQVSTYPNPFTDYVELEIFSEGSSTATVRIFNTIGREVYNTELALSEGYQNARIELSKLTSGVYLMKIDDTELGIKQTVKIVKK